jgi:hypothetical protein
MATMRTKHRVFLPQMRANSDRNSFLANGKMHGCANLLLRIQFDDFFFDQADSE